MGEAASVRVEWLELPTYVPGPDSPYPSYGWARRRGVYPYSARLDLSATSRPVRHRAVVLENRYVKVVVLPDMGGRVFRLYDKVAGQETFMVPPTIKFQNVSVRGAWIAGGIEFNFGHRGHTVHTVSPVSWATRNEPDGGASVWVGSVSRPMESRWAVRIGLKPDRAAMDLEIHTMGPPVLPGMMYWWSNAGVDVTEHSRFFYFGLYANAMHSRHSWPVTDGLDFTWYRNRFVGSDMFLVDTQRDYMGFYDYGRHHGLAQTADRFQAPGQKYFTWGRDMRGRYWDALFSDTDQTYCEIQRGRHPTQGTTEPLPPMAHESWTETWIPIRNTEGFDATESDLVLSVEAEDAGARIHLLSTVPRKKLRLQAASAREALGAWDIHEIAPDKPFAQRVELSQGRRCDRVKVLDADGKVLLNWEEFQFAREDWYKEGHDERLDQNTATTEQLFEEAERARFGAWPQGRRSWRTLYDKILAKDSSHPGALRALAELSMFNGECEQAAERLGKALERRKYDPELLALLGWAQLRSGRADEAAESFANAARSESGRRNGLFGLACAHMRGGRWEDAAAAAERLLAERPADKWGQVLRVMTLRKAGRKKDASKLLRSLLAEDPLWSRVHAEALLLGVPVELADGSRKLADDSVTAATPYIQLGMWEDACAILRLAESDEPFSPAVRLAHLAYVQRRLDDEAAAAATIEEIRSAPVGQAHPWTTTSIYVLSELLEAHANEPALHNMLGNVLASRDRLDEAEAAWKRALELGLEHTVLYRNLGMLAAHRKDHESALKYYRKAWELSQCNLSLLAEYDRLLADRGLHAERLAIYDQLPEDVRGRSTVAMRRVLQLLDLERYEEALAELHGRTFLSGEYEKAIRQNYNEALIGLALPHIDAGRFDQAADLLGKGLEYPRNLNIGRSSRHPEESMMHYLLGLVAEAVGNEQAARKHWLDAATELHYEGSPAQAYEMLAWLALDKRNRALSLIHEIEQTARGEKDISGWHRWLFGSGVLKLIHGLAQLAKGHIDEARKMWAEGVEEYPDGRWLRLHAGMPRCVLERMSRKLTGPQE